MTLLHDIGLRNSDPNECDIHPTLARMVHDRAPA